MSEGPKSGLAAAVAEVAAGAPAGPAERWEQLGMLPPDPDAPDAPGADGVPSGPRGPGRPLGSRNRRTEAIVDYVRANYRHPLLFLARLWSTSPVELLDELRTQAAVARVPLLGNGQVTLLEVLKLQVNAAREGLPYLESKMPVAVNVTQRRLTIVLEGSVDDLRPEGALADLGEGVSMSIREAEKTEEIQGDDDAS